MICFRLVLILNGLTLFFRSEFRSLHCPSSFALSLFTSSNSRLISRVLTNQRLNLLPTFLLRGDLVLNFPSSGKTSFSFSFAALSSDSERAILFFNRWKWFWYLWWIQCFILFFMCFLKHVAKVNQKSNLNLFSECVDSSDLLASFLVFLFLHRLEVPVICQHLLTGSLSIEFATIFKIRKTLDIYLQVPIVSGLILDCRFQVLNLPGTWCK